MLKPRPCGSLALRPGLCHHKGLYDRLRGAQVASRDQTRQAEEKQFTCCLGTWIWLCHLRK